MLSNDDGETSQRSKSGLGCGILTMTIVNVILLAMNIALLFAVNLETACPPLQRPRPSTAINAAMKELSSYC
jgi:hypothetical protein